VLEFWSVPMFRTKAELTWIGKGSRLSARAVHEF
jgi:hypothetical protein